MTQSPEFLAKGAIDDLLSRKGLSPDDYWGIVGKLSGSPSYLTNVRPFIDLEASIPSFHIRVNYVGDMKMIHDFTNQSQLYEFFAHLQERTGVEKKFASYNYFRHHYGLYHATILEGKTTPDSIRLYVADGREG